jgi:hypothetical protein
MKETTQTAERYYRTGPLAIQRRFGLGLLTDASGAK